MVCSAVVPKSTCAPLTNLLPVTVSVKFPVPTLDGLMPVSTGVEFKRLTLLDPVTEGSAELVARMVMALGLGSTAGAV